LIDGIEQEAEVFFLLDWDFGLSFEFGHIDNFWIELVKDFTEGQAI
jgi:hypothetical protein